MDYTIGEWWKSLTVVEKERIGGKITKRTCHYPECTTVWNNLSDETQKRIHDHCVAHHDDEMAEWTEGNVYSY